MPLPSATAPPASHAQRSQPRATVIRPARSSAANEAQMAIATDNATSHQLYETEIAVISAIAPLGEHNPPTPFIGATPLRLHVTNGQAPPLRPYPFPSFCR